MSIAAYSQIANAWARSDFCSLRDAPVSFLSQTADMATQEKNGGENHLRAWREFRKMTREQLAAAVGTTAAVIWHLEEGERGLSAKWLRRLAPALKTTPGMLLDHDPHDLPTDMLEIWLSATENQKRQITSVAEALLQAANG